MVTRREFLKLSGAGLLSLYAAAKTPWFNAGITEPSLEKRNPHTNQGVLGIMPAIGWNSELESWDKKFGVIHEFENTVGRRADLISLFADFGDNLPDPRGVEQILHSGRAMMINLMPRPTRINKTTIYKYLPERFIEGDHDESLKKMAQELRGFAPDNIFMRFGFEMNGDWVLWHTHPDLYVAMWRHVVDIFRENGADNLKWVFAPNNFPNPESIHEYYPGSNYVDAVGPDIYRWGLETPEVNTNKIMYYLRHAAPNKPMMINETGVSDVGKHGEIFSDRDEWLTDFIELALAYGAGLVTYFDFKKTEIDGRTYDWRLRDASKISRFKSLVNSDFFLHEGASLEKINKAILRIN